MSILYEKKGKIAHITLNRPDALNSINPAILEGLHEALTDFRDDDSLWVAVITGAGERAFSAGADLRDTIPRMLDKTVMKPWRGPATIMRGLEVWKPIIAAVNGAALGGGLELALACDLRIASENATFGQPEVRVGVIPGWGGTQRLPRMIPLAKAAELLLTGKPINAQEAYRIGLVNAVVPLAELLPTATKLAEDICQLGPLAVRAAKEAYVKGMSLPLNDGLNLEQMIFDSLRLSEDAEEGVKAFIEKRPAAFKGK